MTEKVMCLRRAFIKLICILITEMGISLGKRLGELYALHQIGYFILRPTASLSQTKDTWSVMSQQRLGHKGTDIISKVHR